MGDPAAGHAFCRRLEMTISREEFLRLLRSFVAGEPSVRADGVTELHTSVLVRHVFVPAAIRLVPLPERRLGSVAMPRHRVEIAIEGCPEEEGEAFMARFHQAFLRGGG